MALETVPVMEHHIETLKQALAALELRPEGRYAWTHAQTLQLSRARIAVRAEIHTHEANIRMAQAADERSRTPERRLTQGSELVSLLGHGR